MENILGKDNIIRLDNVFFEYKTKNNSIPALENINLKIKEGEFLCILGPSGCGKSTLLNIIAGYIKPDAGKCYMMDKVINGPDSSRGVVFQNPTLYPWMSVKDNIEFGPRMRGLNKSQIDKISKHFIKQVNLPDFENSSTFELSGGMKQRVALARVLANYPNVILMDEPFSALDALTRGSMQNLVRNIWTENKNTFLLITHDIDEALSLGTRVIVMSKRPGRLLKEININFTYDIISDKNNHIQYSDSYIKIKDEILDIIQGEIIN